MFFHIFINGRFSPEVIEIIKKIINASISNKSPLNSIKEDIEQEILIHLWKHRDSFESKPETYIKQAIRNKLKSLVTAAKRQSLIVPMPDTTPEKKERDKTEDLPITPVDPNTLPSPILPLNSIMVKENLKEALRIVAAKGKNATELIRLIAKTGDIQTAYPSSGMSRAAAYRLVDTLRQEVKEMLFS